MRRVARRWVELSTGEGGRAGAPAPSLGAAPARPVPFARTFARLWAAPARALVEGERQEVNRDS